MVKYGIPQIFLQGFNYLIKLDQQQIENLSYIIQTTKVGDSVETIVNANKIAGLDTDELNDILNALFSIVSIFDSSKRNIDEFTTDFFDFINYIEKNTTDEDRLLLKNNLSTLLPHFKSVRLTVKSQRLILENSNNFRDARVVSDIRIVFDEDNLDDKDQYALVVHKLKLDYSAGGDRKVFFISLDLSDLKKMQKVIERALEKDNSIRRTSHNLQFVDLN